MFRLNDYGEGSELYKYLSSIASNTIYEALNEWVQTPDNLQEVYMLVFAEHPESVHEGDYFKGIARHLKLTKSAGAGTMYRLWFSRSKPWKDYTDDDLTAMEFLYRKIGRMKEKMLDPETYYTFDLFEEFLFSSLINETDVFEKVKEEIMDNGIPVSELFDGAEEGSGSRKKDSGSSQGTKLERIVTFLQEKSETEKHIAKTREELINRFGLDKEEASWLASTVHKISMMGIDSAEEAGFESIFFWDDDYSVFFAETGSFQEAVEELIGGAGATMGYRYENIAEIFTDPGYEIPLLMIGTKAAYELREENMKKQMHQMPFPTFPNTDPPKLPEGNDDTLPFS